MITRMVRLDIFFAPGPHRGAPNNHDLRAGRLVTPYIVLFWELIFP
jgi:hypothetical protein